MRLTVQMHGSHRTTCEGGTRLSLLHTLPFRVLSRAVRVMKRTIMTTMVAVVAVIVTVSIFRKKPAVKPQALLAANQLLPPMQSPSAL